MCWMDYFLAESSNFLDFAQVACQLHSPTYNSEWTFLHLQCVLQGCWFVDFVTFKRG